MWLGTNGVTGGSNRSSIWSITSMCCIASPAHWPDRSRWSRSGKPVCGRPSFDRIWEALIERHGKQSGTRQMIDLLKLSQKHGQQKLQEAVESALSSSCYDAAAVQHLLNAEDLRHRRVKPSMSVRWSDMRGRCR